jgi:hypothetical protein
MTGWKTIRDFVLLGPLGMVGLLVGVGWIALPFRWMVPWAMQIAVASAWECSK